MFYILLVSCLAHIHAKSILEIVQHAGPGVMWESERGATGVLSNDKHISELLRSEPV